MVLIEAYLIHRYVKKKKEKEALLKKRKAKNKKKPKKPIKRTVKRTSKRKR